MLSLATPPILDPRQLGRQDRAAMFPPKVVIPSITNNPLRQRVLVVAVVIAVCLATAAVSVGQSVLRDLDTPEKVSLSIRSRNGRVGVIASDDRKRVAIEATSSGAPVESRDIQTVVKGANVEIEVRQRRDQDRIDLLVRVPSRTRLKIVGESGAVDVVGDLEFADVQTNTGTIHADVPLDALNFSFLWHASRPRFLSDVQLPDVKERAAGIFTISGTLKDDQLSSGKKANKKWKKSGGPQSVRLDFRTERGVVLLNVDPAMVPSDLRERPLTEAAKAIMRSGDANLMDAIRKVSPKMFGDYASTLPAPARSPTLLRSTPPGQLVSTVSPELLRVHASVTDRNGRAISNLRTSDFTVYENGIERQVTSVTPSTEPFNLVLLLDVSGSVEERIDFIRKAARDFLRTASPQDRIAIISFHDDIQVVSDFTTDRNLLSKKLDEIDAGGATALYDAVAYVLSTMVRRVRAERTAIVILSDGDDNKSFIPAPALEEATIESGALIYPLYVPSGLIPENSVARADATVDPLRSRYLTLTTRAEEDGRKLAAASGGVYYPVHRLEDLQRAYDDVIAQLRTAYTITYTSNSNPSERHVRVRTNRDGAAVRLGSVVGVAAP
jgi:VWFA-related protein